MATFCELLRRGGPSSSSGGGGTEAALAYGRSTLSAHRPRGPAEEELLSDALSLLAYEQPEVSPCGHLMSQVCVCGGGWLASSVPCVCGGGALPLVCV